MRALRFVSDARGLRLEALSRGKSNPKGMHLPWSGSRGTFLIRRYLISSFPGLADDEDEIDRCLGIQR